MALCLFRYSFVNIRTFAFEIWLSIPLGCYRNKFRVILFTIVSLQSVLTCGAKISFSTHFTFFYFREGKKATEDHKEICEVYGVNCLTERTCQNLFKKFRSGDFSLKDLLKLLMT